jgi:hypothetical protein
MKQVDFDSAIREVRVASQSGLRRICPGFIEDSAASRRAGEGQGYRARAGDGNPLAGVQGGDKKLVDHLSTKAEVAGGKAGTRSA